MLQLKELFVAILLTRLAAAADEFVFTGFAGKNLFVSGVAAVTPTGLLQLTNDTNESFGHGFYPVPLRFKNVSTGASLSFSTTFVFAIAPQYPNAHGHGVVFALSPSPTVPGAVDGKNLGLFNTSDDRGNGRSRIVAVEFDTAMDKEFQDINDNHVGIDVNSLISVNSSPAAYIDGGTGRFKNLSLVSARSLQVWIDYDGESARLDVVMSPAGSVRPAVPLVSHTVNLSSAVADDTYVGFSAANGAAASSHYIQGWSFRLRGGRAPDLDLSKLPALPSGKSKNKRALLLLVTLLAVAVMVLFLVSAAVAWLVVRRRRFAEEEEDWEVEYGPHRIRYKDLYKATKGFSEENAIGVGGFGRVYRGVLRRTRTEVAVKKISHDSRQGLPEFVSEIASMNRLRHRNLVQLLGYCRRRGELVLVYDYMANGSLDRHLFGADRPALGWAQRSKIIRDVAAGLLYLHEGWEQVVVHRDIKASNVLLDGDMNGKLSDFGLARLYDHGSNPQTTHVVGTLGYLAPEMSKTGKATTSTDVFAFGAFLLEVACGRRPMEFSPQADAPGLVELVLAHWKAGRIGQARDPRIGSKCDEEEVELVLKLGLLCSHPDPKSRPNMRQVVQILEGTAPPPAELPEGLGDSGRLFEYDCSFDEFVTLLPTTSEITTAMTQPSSSSSRSTTSHH